MTTKQTFIDLLRQNAAHTVFPEMYNSWVSKHATPEKAAAFRRMLAEPVTLEWLRSFAKSVSDSAMRLLQSKEDPQYEYDSETIGQRIRRVAALMTIYVGAVSRIRGTLDVVHIRTAKLPTSRLSEFLGERDYEPSKTTPAITLADRSDMAINDPANTAVVIGSMTPAGQDMLVNALFKLNRRVLATINVHNPVDPATLENSIRSLDPKLIVTRMNSGGGTLLQARVVIKHRLPEYKLVRRIIDGYTLICFQRTEVYADVLHAPMVATAPAA